MIKKHLQRGFTLIELLVVIAIIGLLSSIVLVGLNAARQTAIDARVLSEVEQIKVALQLYFNDHGGYPVCDTDVTTSEESQACCIGDADPATPGDQCYFLGSEVTGTLTELVAINTHRDSSQLAAAYVSKGNFNKGYVYVCPAGMVLLGGPVAVCGAIIIGYAVNNVEKYITVDGSTCTLDTCMGGGDASNGNGGTPVDTDGDGIPDGNDVCAGPDGSPDTNTYPSPPYPYPYPDSGQDLCSATVDGDGDGTYDNLDGNNCDGPNSNLIPACSNGSASPIYGCTDQSASNYNDQATSDDGSCQYNGSGSNGSGSASPSDRDSDGKIDSEDSCPDTQAYTVDGCPDADQDGWTTVSDYFDDCPDSNNYSYRICNDDDYDGVTLLYDYYDDCYDPSNQWYRICNDIDADGYTLLYDYFDTCHDPNNNSYNICEGGGSGSNGNGSASPIYGCTDQSASNYNDQATSDDGSCQYNGSGSW